MEDATDARTAGFVTTEIYKERIRQRHVLSDLEFPTRHQKALYVDYAANRQPRAILWFSTTITIWTYFEATVVTDATSVWEH